MSSSSHNPTSLGDRFSIIREIKPQDAKYDAGSSSHSLPPFIHSLKRECSESECAVCMETSPKHSMPSRKISAVCNHEAWLCRSCLSRSTRSDLESKIWNWVTCPQCPAILRHEDIQEFADGEILLGMSVLENSLWCMGSQCESGQEHTGGTEQPIVVGVACGFRTCFRNNVAWHEALSCDQYNLITDTENHQTAFEDAENWQAGEMNASQVNEEEEGVR